MEEFIRDVPDFPKPGILFKDITPLLQSPAGPEARRSRAWRRWSIRRATTSSAASSRAGFIFGTALAH